MHILSRLRLRTKLALLLVLSVIAIVATVVVGATTLREHMINDRMAEYRAVVTSTVELARALEARVVSHELTHAQAFKELYDDVHAIRFDSGLGYISVVDMTSAEVVIHGVNAALEGKPGAIDGASHRSISLLVIDAVQSADEGTTSYLFPRPGGTIPLEKLVAVARFRPWNIVLYAGAYTDDLDAQVTASLLRMATTGGAILLITLTAAWLVNRDIVGSLGRLKAAMQRIAMGQPVAAVPGVERRDEVGEMAATVEIFKAHAADRARLEAEQRQQAEAATEEKRLALVKMAETIEEETKSAIEQIAGHTSAMASVAEGMNASATRTRQAADSATTAAGHALANAQTVASAAEELTSSIREIGGQVQQSTKVVGAAVAAGTEARETIEALNERVARIGAVAEMISEIAGKTNLLALNATIEAARAGEAGKGFAVVASEVKALATQTARSTQEISQHIGEIRLATGASVAAVTRIGDTIGQVNAIAGSIAAAVEQQGAATAEIARNVTETAEAAREMTSQAKDVSAEAEQTGVHAATVMQSTSALGNEVTQLRQAVIRVVRTATTEVDRRQSQRYPTNLPCRISVGGQSHAARVTDISDGGAGLSEAPPLQPGTRGSLSVDAVGMPLDFTVCGSEGGMLHLAFKLDDATTERLRALLPRLGRAKAA